MSLNNVVQDIESYTSEQVHELMEQDQKLVDLLNSMRLRIKVHPSQSNFRVIALFIVQHTVFKTESGDSPQRLSFVCGSNAEQGYIGGAICAERATLCRLRFYENVKILKVVITTDSEHPISPGALCREFLMTAADPDTPIVLGNESGSIVVDSKLAEFWPFPYQYRYCIRCNAMSTATDFSSKVKANQGESLQRLTEQYPFLPSLLDSARSVNSYDSADYIHPIRFSAAVYFSDGHIAHSWFLKALEYGASVEPVVQLIGQMKEYPATRSSSCQPLVLVMLDQFDVCHAPFAAARTLLLEHGFGELKVLHHDEDGQLAASLVKDLFPVSTAKIGSTFTHDDFRD